LLANLRFDVSIVRMQLLQFASEGVGVGGCELGFAEAADGVDLVFVFTSAFSVQPSTFRMAPSVMDSPMRDCWPLS
jgi:hypothetical protein